MQDSESPRIRRLVLAATAALTGGALLGTALSPYLIAEHPLWLLALNPDGRHLLLVANEVEPWQALAVGSMRRALSFLATFALAQIYAQRFVAWMRGQRPWMQRIVRFIEQAYARLGVWLVLSMPFTWVAGVAGSARMPWRRFAIAMVPGQVVYVGAMLWFGAAIESWTEPVYAFVADHPVGLTAAALAVVGAQVAWSRLRRRDGEGVDGLVPDRGVPRSYDHTLASWE